MSFTWTIINFFHFPRKNVPSVFVSFSYFFSTISVHSISLSKFESFLTSGTPSIPRQKKYLTKYFPAMYECFLKHVIIIKAIICLCA